MKAMLLAVVVIVVVIGACVYAVYRDPNRAQTQDALAVLHEGSSGVPADPDAVGYLHLSKRQSDALDGFSVEAAMKLTQPRLVEGTLLKQEYLLRQAEYKLAQLKSIGGAVSSGELEERRIAYATATKNFQTFLGNEGPSLDGPSFPN